MDEPRLGIDIGKVIINGPAHPEQAGSLDASRPRPAQLAPGGDTAFFTGDEATMLATPEVPGAVETIARLVTLFDGNVWIVSKCGPRVQERTERWLVAHDFFARTGVDPAHVRF